MRIKTTGSTGGLCFAHFVINRIKTLIRTVTANQNGYRSYYILKPKSVSVFESAEQQHEKVNNNANSEQSAG